MSGPEYDLVPIEVCAVQSANGDVRVLLQLPANFVLVAAAEARQLAAMLLDAADAVDDATPGVRQ